MLLIYENETEYAPEFDLQKTAEKVIFYILEKEDCPFEVEVNLTITDNEGIHSVNREFREIDAPTDVLSFPVLEFESPADFKPYLDNPDSVTDYDYDTEMVMLGDILISKDRVISQAEEYGHSEKREFAFLVAHSTLHLLGYDHMTEDEAKVMEDKQKAYLDELGITRD